MEVKTIHISEFNAELEAKRVFESKVPSTDNLEVIDALIKLYPEQVQFRRTRDGALLEYSTAHTCRYDLGQDYVRPGRE